MTFTQDLRIDRGAPFGPVAWIVPDGDGWPLRSTVGVDVAAAVKAWRGADEVLHHFRCSAQLRTFAGEHDDQPVVVAQIDEMTGAETAALGFDRAVYDVRVSGVRLGGGRVAAPGTPGPRRVAAPAAEPVDVAEHAPDPGPGEVTRLRTRRAAPPEPAAVAGPADEHVLRLLRRRREE